MRVMVKKLLLLTMSYPKAQRQHHECSGLEKGSGSHQPCSATASLLNHTTVTHWKGYWIILWKQRDHQKGKGKPFSTVINSVDDTFSYMSAASQLLLKRLLKPTHFFKSAYILENSLLKEKAKVAGLHIHWSMSTPRVQCNTVVHIC